MQPDEAVSCGAQAGLRIGKGETRSAPAKGAAPVHRPVLFRPRFERSLYVTAPSVMRNGAREGEWKVILLLRQGSDDPLVKIETPLRDPSFLTSQRGRSRASTRAFFAAVF